MGSEYVSREKKLPMVNFLIFVQKNVSTIRFQEIKIRPFGDFEKMRFLCFYIIKSMARKGYFGPKSDFRGSKYPPEVRVRHETCSTICGTHVQAILDQKNLTGLAGGVREGQNCTLHCIFAHFPLK